MTTGRGVYGLAVSYGFGLTVVYVGKSGNLQERLTYWLNNPPTIGISHFYAEAFDTDAAMSQREEQLIRELQPTCNTLLK